VINFFIVFIRKDEMSGIIEWAPSAVTFLYSNVVRSRIKSLADRLIVLEGSAEDTCRLSGLSPPIGGLDAANKAYVDSLFQSGPGGSIDALLLLSDEDSVSPVTGALRVNGGVGVVKNIHCGAQVYATAFAATSDARLKTKIRPAAQLAERLSSVRARQYEFKCEPGRIRCGVLAQDLIEAGVKDSVFEVDGVYAVDYNALTALLLDRVNALENRLRQLESGESQTTL
jgi:hypothetical protein